MRHGYAKRKAGSTGDMAKFRFHDLEIWQMAIEIADELFDIADTLDKKQLRGAGMSMSNNIAEGSGPHIEKRAYSILEHCSKVHIRERQYFDSLRETQAHP